MKQKGKNEPWNPMNLLATWKGEWSFDLIAEIKEGIVRACTLRGVKNQVSHSFSFIFLSYLNIYTIGILERKREN